MASYEELSSRYTNEQEKIWNGVNDLFTDYISNYNVSIAEISEGLGVSRQLIYNFRNSPIENNLGKATRADFLRLWAYISDPEKYKNKKLEASHKEARERLRNEGPDQLLRIAGFLPTQESIKASSGVHLLKRVQARLSSNWIQDDILREYLINDILDKVLDQGRMDTKYYVDPLKYSNKDDKQKIYAFPDQEELYIPSLEEDLSKEELKKKYISEIDKLARSGKIEYVRSELFELYQSIFEHHILNKDFKSRAIILDCQFETISPDVTIFKEFEIEYNKNNNNEKLIFYNGCSLEDYEYNAESGIFSQGDFQNHQDKNDIEHDYLPRVTRAKVTCSFFNQTSGDEPEYTNRVFFSKISTATHIENMLIAIKKGLGYELNIAGFFVRATGRTTKSLARVSVGLQRGNQATSREVYQGWWVTSNTIMGILKAAGDAFSRYLSTSSLDEKKYYELCYKISALKEDIYRANSYLYEGESNLSPTENKVKKSFIDYINKLIERVDEIKNDFDFILRNQFSSSHSCELNHLSKTAKLIAIHASFIKGEPNQYRKFIEDIEKSKNEDKKLEISSDPYSRVIHLHNISCLMRYYFMAGKIEFLSRAKWRNETIFKASSFLKELGRYTLDVGNIDYEAYFCASQVIGIIGQLDLYAIEPVREELEEAVGLLIKAAHYSCRIGHNRRASQWIINAARICSRLKTDDDLRKADTLIELAIEMEMHPLKEKEYTSSNSSKGFSDTSGDWLEVNRLISKGELLIARESYKDAAPVFFNALIVIYGIDYIRIAPDCLYGLHRALEGLIKNHRGENPMPVLVPWKSDPDNSTPIKMRIWEILSDAEILRQENSFTEDNIEIFWKDISQKCRSIAAEIWNIWARSSGNEYHPFGKAIENGDFWKDLKS